MRALRQSLPAFRDLEGRLPLLPPVERRPSPHVLAETPPKRGSLQMEANMGEVIRFVSKAERERLRLIQEARATYDSVFPSDVISGRTDKAPTIDVRHSNIRS